jgi:hypothetical protein
VCSSSFTDDNIVLSVSLEESVNMIADSVDFVFLSNVTLEDSLIQRQQLFELNSDATSWVKTLVSTKDQ